MNNKYIYSKPTPNSIIVFAIFSLILMSTLNNTATSFNELGTLIIVVVLGLTTSLFYILIGINKKMYKVHFYFLIPVVIFIGLQTVGLIQNLDARGIITYFQFILLIGFTLFISSIEWTSYRVLIIGRIAVIFITFHATVFIFTGFQDNFSSIYLNSNIIGPYMLFTSFFIILARKHARFKFIYTLTLVLAYVLIYASGTRSALVAAGLAFITYLLWPYFSKSKLLYIFYMILTISSLMLFTFTYHLLPRWEKFYQLDLFIINLTGKRLMSGREEIWTDIIYFINQRPILGHGTGTLPRDFHLMSNDLSSHSLYIQTALQNGYVGLFIFFTIILVIWLMFYKVKSVESVRLSGAFLIAILIHQLFEVSFTQNQLGVGMLQWLIIGIGLSSVIFSRNTSK